MQPYFTPVALAVHERVRRILSYCYVTSLILYTLFLKKEHPTFSLVSSRLVHTVDRFTNDGESEYYHVIILTFSVCFFCKAAHKNYVK